MGTSPSAFQNALTAEDARIIDAAGQRILEICRDPELDQADRRPALSTPKTTDVVTMSAVNQTQPATTKAYTVLPLTKPSRKRNKAHLAFVASQPCLVCQRSPCDAHHLKFAQPQALGRKVSDEFTVPLCREHHHELHTHGNETAWWANLQIAPVDTAQKLWRTNLVHNVGSFSNGPTDRP